MGSVLETEFTLSKFSEFINNIKIYDDKYISNFLLKYYLDVGLSKSIDEKLLIIISGGIATGKSTIAYNLIKKYAHLFLPYICCDIIYNNSYKNSHISFNKSYNKARKHTNKILKQLVLNNTSFIWETVFSKKKKELFLSKCKKLGYKIVSIFINVENCTCSIMRSSNRESNGNHCIDKTFIIDRHYKSLKSLKKLQELSDISVIIDNTTTPIMLDYKDNRYVLH